MLGNAEARRPIVIWFMGTRQLCGRPQRERSGHRLAPSRRGLRKLLEDEQLLTSGKLGQDLFGGRAVRARASGSKVQFLAVVQGTRRSSE